LYFVSAVTQFLALLFTSINEAIFNLSMCCNYYCKITIDYDKGQIIINDGSFDRVLIGEL